MVMKKLKPLPKKIPKFKDYEEEAQFWESHETSRLFDSAKPARFELARPVKHLISIRVDHTLLDGLKALAAKRHMPYQTLIHTLLAEKLGEERRK
jgi:predicted DNA binding CopG/RHH family protein